MKPAGNPWVVDYIKTHQDGISRFKIDQYLLGLGYDAGTIEEGWKIASVRPKAAWFNPYRYLFPVAVLCSILSWFCLLLPWYRVPFSESSSPNPLLYWNFVPSLSFDVRGSLLYLPLVLWSINSLIGLLVRYFEKGRQGKYYKIVLHLNFALILVAGAAGIFFIVGNEMQLDWPPGPLALFLLLLTALTCNFIELNYPRKKVRFEIFA